MANAAKRRARIDPERLTIKELLGALTAKQLFALASLSFGLLAGSFFLGANVDSYFRSVETNSVEAMRIQQATLQAELGVLRRKQTFLEATAALQFHAILLGKRPADLMGNLDQSSEAEFAEAGRVYRQAVVDVVRPSMSALPIAHVSISRGLSSPLQIVFQHDNSTYVVMRPAAEFLFKQ